MNQDVKRIILFSQNSYDEKYDSVLEKLIDEKILLFCAVGKDCELWHDVMDEIFVSDGKERDFFMITTWHTDETLDEVIEFAKDFYIEGIENEKIKIIEV